MGGRIAGVAEKPKCKSDVKPGLSGEAVLSFKF
jgi:hypothetical protein